MSETHVAIATDANYVPWAATAIRSLLDAVSTPPTVHLLVEPGFDRAEEARLREMTGASGATLRVHSVREAGDHLPAVDRFGTIVWLRFRLPELLPDVDRVLYLDADTLVVEDPADLFAVDLDGAPLGAVRNVVEPSMREHVTSLGIGDARDFFNSGVLLMDLARMRDLGTTGELIRFASDPPVRLVWPDQDALNVVFAGRWHPLHPRYNAMNSLWMWPDLAGEVFGPDVVAEAKARPVVLHFEGPVVCKPWHQLCPHPWRERYRATLATTPWRDTPVSDRTVATRAIARLPERWRLPAYWRLVGLRRRAR